MKKVLLFFLIFAIIILGVLVYYYFGFKDALPSNQRETGPKPKISMEEKVLQGKKIAMVVAFRDFRDEEYFIPKEILERAGAEISTMSTFSGKAIGVQGGETDVDLLINDFKVDDFDAIIFIGGEGATKYVGDERANNIAREAVEKEKLLAAICIAPTILAKAGVLEGKKATVWSNILDKSAIKILKEGQAEYLEGPVVVDGNIITANGPGAAKEFAEKIIEGLTNK